MVTYFMWSLPLPLQLKVLGNILATVLLFLAIRTISGSLFLADLLLALILVSLALLIFALTLVGSTFHTILITTLTLILLLDFRFFVVCLSTSLLFFFVKAFTRGSAETYQNLLAKETKKSLRQVYEKKIKEHRYLELSFLSVLIFFILTTHHFFLTQSQINGERDVPSVYQNIYLSILLCISLFQSIERKTHFSS